MKENEIRPERLMKKAERLLQEDIKRMLRRQDCFVKVPCPACASESHRFLFKKRGFKFVLCTECETMFVNPRPNFDLLNEFYTSSRYMKFWDDQIYPLSEDSRRKKIFVPRVKRVLELCKKHKIDIELIVDVGAGFGTFCEEIGKKISFDKIIAVEPSLGLAKTCRNKGITVIDKCIEDAKLEAKKINVITNFELVEHVFSPKDFLLGCSRVLRKGGLMIITTLNIKGFDLSVLGKISDNIDGPSHLNYFHVQSLTHLLEQCGFEVLETLTPGKLDTELVRSKIINGKFDGLINPFFRHLLVQEWDNCGESFQKFLAEHRLSSHLWIVAKKIID